MSNFELLENAGFEEFTCSEVWPSWWMNLRAQMAFSQAGVKDADSAWLSHQSRATGKGTAFLFYFAHGEQMDLAVCEKIIALHTIESCTPLRKLIVAKRQSSR
jgi:hypothetical protein